MNGLNADASVIFNLVAASLVLIFGLLVCGVMLSLFPPWMRSFLGGAPVMVLNLIGMRLRGVPPGLVVDALVTLAQRGHPHDQNRVRQAESIYLAQRGLINSAAQLADQMEREIKAGSETLA